jgi:type IV secretory pathway TrbD component
MRGTPAIYFQSLNRSFNILGIDRQLFFLFVGLSIPIALSGRLAPLMDLIALAVFVIFCAIGMVITRIDNQMLAIYRRHIHYQKYYAATPGAHAKIPLIKHSVPLLDKNKLV